MVFKRVERKPVVKEIVKEIKKVAKEVEDIVEGGTPANYKGPEDAMMVNVTGGE